VNDESVEPVVPPVVFVPGPTGESAPGFPAHLCLQGGPRPTQSSGAPRRERMRTHISRCLTSWIDQSSGPRPVWYRREGRRGRTFWFTRRPPASEPRNIVENNRDPFDHPRGRPGLAVRWFAQTAHIDGRGSNVARKRLVRRATLTAYPAARRSLMRMISVRPIRHCRRTQRERTPSFAFRMRRRESAQALRTDADQRFDVAAVSRLDQVQPNSPKLGDVKSPLSACAGEWRGGLPARENWTFRSR